MFDDRLWSDGEDLPPVPWPSLYDSPLEDLIGPWPTAAELAAAEAERDRATTARLHALEHAPVDSELAAVDLAACSDDERIGALAAAQRQINHYEGVKAAAVAAFAGPEPRDDLSPGAFAWTEIGAALHLGEATARSVTHLSRHLMSHLPGTWAAMVSGDLSYPKARTLAEATTALTRQQCAEVEARVLGKAAGRNPSQHTAAVGRAVRAVDPDGWARRREQKLADVAMIRFTHGDGVADVLLKSLDSYESELLWTAATTWARQAKAAGDPRTLDALRVAAILHWSKDYLTSTPITPAESDAPADAGADPAGEAAADGQAVADDVRTAPTRNGEPATVNVIIGLPDLIDPARGGAATVAGSGEPLPAEAVADLLRQGARIRFALVDTNGRLVGVSTKRHDPTVLQRVFVALRDLTIRVPGGSITPVAGQDLDHLDPHGPTEPDNLHPPSRGWHRAKTYGHWAVTANNDGTITWTSRRTGRTYTTHPFNHRDDP